MDQLSTPKAGRPHGLGEILNDGYALTDHVVVDENHTFDGNNDVIEKLITGFKTFKEGVFKQKPELYDKLRVGQEPKIMMITCADSRVCPTMLHGLEAGEAFIVRNVANLVPPCEESGQHHGTSAAIEYAVTVLNVRRVVYCLNSTW
uniref:Carbonic anhydrase n=1 Tax=Physcomitrium patens TaxID=3218 RepID=A0A7I4F6T5_PHYPA